MDDTATDTLDDLIREFDTAMLVTRSLSGKLRARPMSIAERSDGGTLYFATRAETGKLEEILQAPEVAVTMQSGGIYLSISGEAHLLTGQLLAEEMWSDSMHLWFPEGHGDPQFTVILVDPDYAEYWDRTGLKRFEFLGQAGKALLRSETPDDDALHGHRKVRL